MAFKFYEDERIEKMQLTKLPGLDLAVFITSTIYEK